MSKLSDFLLENAVDNIVEEVVISERFKTTDETGKSEVLKFKIKAISHSEFSELQKKHTKVSKKGAANIDMAKIQMELVVNNTLEPNFRDAKLLKKAGCMTPEQFVNKTLLAGELTNLAGEILLLSGFDQDLEEIKAEAKN